MVRSYFRLRPLTVAQQALRMRAYWANFTSKWSAGSVVWSGVLQPTPLSAAYLIRIRYALGSHPETRVVLPTLRDISGGGGIPHTYPDGSLCLYRPSYGEWTSRRFIADTIVPWASLWLAHYELWLATGEWHGGGEHPGR